MSERVEWRTVYGNKRMAFLDGLAAADYYPIQAVEGEAYRARVFRKDTMEARWAQVALDKEAAEAWVLGLLERAMREAVE